MKIDEHPRKISCCGGFYAYKNFQIGSLTGLQHLNTQMEPLWNWKSKSAYTSSEPYTHLWLGTKELYNYRGVRISRYFRKLAEGKQQQEDKQVLQHLLPERAGQNR
ncbi:MAG: hypothetical protein IPH69_01825 [Bacteroidales bacterium]|nr:hypothetical protein [Bacteroidales bacterium]